ncbi:MAG: ferric reductase-like transmembrane domain-containing protein, partial [Candidatus Nomurabacteria bacterium]|nr:ferric reductase-like transmembrane domain-containing protein [Candidatus Nomurabacteria bacterium]
MNLIVILSAIPVIIWAFMAPIASRFADLNSITTSIGQILGLVGMALFSINLILAGRFKWLDRYFSGLDKVYHHHSKIGALAFSMLLFHPLMLVVKYLVISTQEAALFFVPFTNMPITWGIIALLIMIILISFTFYIKLKYNTWKMSHYYMKLAFFFAVIHTFLISSDISRNNLLRYYMFALVFVAALISIRKFVYDKLSIKKFKYKVVKVVELNRDIVEVEMEALRKKMIFTAGQFAFFSFLSLGVTGESHPFSISSSTKENNLKITVKNLGDFTSTLKSLKLNDIVIVDGPYGNFSYNNFPSKDQIWIAGGIGITPFYSMAISLDAPYKVDLYYSVKENMEAVYVKELIDLSQKNSNFRFKLWSAKDRGYINGESVVNLSSGL